MALKLICPWHVLPSPLAPHTALAPEGRLARLGCSNDPQVIGTSIWDSRQLQDTAFEGLESWRPIFFFKVSDLTTARKSENRSTSAISMWFSFNSDHFWSNPAREDHLKVLHLPRHRGFQAHRPSLSESETSTNWRVQSQKNLEITRPCVALGSLLYINIYIYIYLYIYISIYIYRYIRLQRSNPPGHRHGSAIVLSPSPCGVAGACGAGCVVPG